MVTSDVAANQRQPSLQKPVSASTGDTGNASDDSHWEANAGSPSRGHFRRPGGLAELLLSTFLLLTAFFAVLVTLSEFEESRTQRVLNSIAKVFATEIPSSEWQPFSDADEKTAFASDANELRRLIERSLAVTANVSNDGQRMRFAFPADRLFEGQTAKIKTTRQVMLGRLAQQLAGQSGYGSTTLYIVGDLSGGSSSDIRVRLVELEKRLVQLGADRMRIRFGFEDTADGSWQFELRYGVSSG